MSTFFSSDGCVPGWWQTWQIFGKYIREIADFGDVFDFLNFLLCVYMNIRNMEQSTAVCVETIVKLKKDVQYYRRRLAKEFDQNRRLHGALIKIRENTEKGYLAALSGKSASTTQAWGSST